MYAFMRIYENKTMNEISALNRPTIAEVTRLHADMCYALADPKRILILYALAERSQNVTDLANQIKISQPTASRHLKILRERGLVKATRDGVNMEYRLADYRLITALDQLRSVLKDQLEHQASLFQS
jgi:ArsR family transcriptional regulator